MRATIVAAGGLACAGAAMTIAAFAGAGSDSPAADRTAAKGPRHGLTVWIEQGCGSCHTFEPANAHMPMGPDLQLSLHGKSRDYVRESIVLPSKNASPGGARARCRRTTRSGSRPRTSIRSSTSSSMGCARAEYAARVLR